MAYYFRRYYRKRYYRRNYRRFYYGRRGTATGSQYNYFKCAFEYMGTMTYPATVPGDFGILKGQSIVDYLRYDDILLANPQFATYHSMFEQYRVRGASLEVIGAPKNMSNGDIMNVNPIVAGISLNTIPIDFTEAMQNNGTLTLNPIGKTRKYVLFPFELKNWYKTDDTPTGALYAYANGNNGTQLDSPSFTFKLTLYITFRHSKV